MSSSAGFSDLLYYFLSRASCQVLPTFHHYERCLPLHSATITTTAPRAAGYLCIRVLLRLLVKKGGGRLCKSALNFQKSREQAQEQSDFYSSHKLILHVCSTAGNQESTGVYGAHGKERSLHSRYPSSPSII